MRFCFDTPPITSRPCQTTRDRLRPKIDFTIYATHHQRRHYSTKPPFQTCPRLKSCHQTQARPTSPQRSAAPPALGGGVRKGVGRVTTDILCISVLFFWQSSKSEPGGFTVKIPAVAGTSDDRAHRAMHLQTRDLERIKTGYYEQEGKSTPPDPARTRSPAIILEMSGFRSDALVGMKGVGRLGLFMG